MNSLINLDLISHPTCHPDEFLDYVHETILKCIEKNSDSKLRIMALRHFETKGKMLRPLFIRDLALSFNLDLGLVIPWAVTCELLHSATLIHDDLQDGDELRRSQPTTWKEYGPEQAINLGDFFLIIAPQTMILSHIPCKNELLHLFTVMSSRIVAGQVEEFDLNKFEGEKNLFEKYLICISGKTSSLFSGLALGVGITAGISQEALQYLESIFFQLGHIFQIQDDILDFYGDKQKGLRGSDIREGKLSFLIAHHLERNPEDFEIFSSILKKKRADTTDDDLKIIEQLFHEKNNLEHCLDHLESRVDDLLSHSFFETNEILFKVVNTFIEKVLVPIKEISRKQINS
jgi:geranylgeranyl diphosphate synthase type I